MISSRLEPSHEQNESLWKMDADLLLLRKIGELSFS